jgi:hypothetical protein
MGDQSERETTVVFRFFPSPRDLFDSRNNNLRDDVVGAIIISFVIELIPTIDPAKVKDHDHDKI